MRFAHLLLFSLALVGCPKGGGGSAETLSAADATNPAANFANGVSILQNPDRKTGAVDYVTAYDRFNFAANNGAGAKASFNAGWVAEQLGRPDDAALHYRKAWETDPNYAPAMFSLARVLEEQGRAGEAVAIYKANADKNPTDWDARSAYVGALIAAGQFELALSESQEVLRHKPDDPAVYRNLSSLYYTQKNYSMSQLTAEKALSINSSDPGILNNMGVTYLIQGDEPAAIAKFKAALAAAPNNFEANMNLGWVALNSGDYALAKTCFVAATTANPANLDGKLGLAIATRGVGEFKEAGELYDQIIEANFEYEKAYINAATLHMKYTKDFAKAQRYADAYITSKGGQILQSDPIYALKAEIQRLQAEEDERKRIEAEKKRAEEERQRRNEELLAGMAKTVADAEAKIAANSSCLDPSFVEEVNAVLEQAKEVVTAKDADMAPDIQQFLDAYIPPLDEAVAACAGGAAPAPAPEGEAPAPAPE